MCGHVVVKGQLAGVLGRNSGHRGWHQHLYPPSHPSGHIWPLKSRFLSQVVRTVQQTPVPVEHQGLLLNCASSIL